MSTRRLTQPKPLTIVQLIATELKENGIAAIIPKEYENHFLFSIQGKTLCFQFFQCDLTASVGPFGGLKSTAKANSTPDFYSGMFGEFFGCSAIRHIDLNNPTDLDELMNDLQALNART